jgi:hypothetical protein
MGKDRLVGNVNWEAPTVASQYYTFSEVDFLLPFWKIRQGRKRRNLVLLNSAGLVWFHNLGFTAHRSARVSQALCSRLWKWQEEAFPRDVLQVAPEQRGSWAQRRLGCLPRDQAGCARAWHYWWLCQDNRCDFICTYMVTLPSGHCFFRFHSFIFLLRACGGFLGFELRPW